MIELFDLKILLLILWEQFIRSHNKISNLAKNNS